MATYFVGSGLDAFTPSPSGVEDQGDHIGMNTSGATYANAQLIEPSTGDQAEVTDLWLHLHMRTTWGGAEGECIIFYDTLGAPMVRVAGAGWGTLRVEKWSAGTWQQLGIAGGCVLADAGGTLDLRVTIGNPGRIGFFWNQALVWEEIDLDLSGLGNGLIGGVRLAPCDRTYYSRYHSLIVASYCTIGHIVRRRYPSGDGSNTGWLGGYPEVDDTWVNDSDTVSTSEVDAKITFTSGALSPPAEGNLIKCVAVAARLRNDGGDAPQHICPLIEIDGTTYEAPVGLLINAGFSGSIACWDIDPSTGEPWASIDAVNGEFGLKAVA